ncbi:MAG: site-specific DNA-methyltransferase [Proteobacteria bacterium]|nr:site-specific DNA-methyltransferase [Pseudomonadota bacterium]
MPTLDWLNRSAAFTTAAQVPYRLLDNVSTHGDTEAAQHNLLIQGDNLEALKALLPFYRGRVKCIFIDPPYNTQSAFEHYDDNLEHSQWLSMMLPRLQLLRELLREDGSIWVTIDDNEGHYLKVLMDEVFGRRNFVANVVWQKKYSPQNDAEFFSAMHDHVFVYAKKASIWSRNLIPRTSKQDDAYKNRDNDARGPWKASDLTRAEHRDRDFYAITTPSGKQVFPARGRSWSRPPEEIERLRIDDRLWFGKNGDAIPSLKRFLSEVKDGVVPQTIWFRDEVGDNQDAKKEVKGLNANEIFGTPKPEALIRRVLDIATNPNDLVLDSFLGSGTTAAVAHKMGRRWIGIEMGEHAATHCLPRLEKVIAGEQGGISSAVNWQGGGGFRFARLGAPIFDAHGCIHPDVRFATLAAFVWQQETGTAFDPALGRPGTPWLGVHSVFESCSRLSDKAEVPISLQISDAPVLRSRTAYYLLFNGILGDKRPASGNVLTRAVLEALLQLHAATPHPEAPLVVYGEANRLGPETLARARVTFKHIPYDVKAR